MPSGARKRKAAKKKHQRVTPASLSADPSSTTSSTQGDEDLKHHESDGDHNTDGEEGVEKSTEDVKNGDVQVEKAAGQDDGGVQVEGESKAGVGFDEKKGDSSSSSGSSSDSDDGSGEVEKNITIEENAPVEDLVKADVLMSDGPTEVSDMTPVTKLEDPLAECVSEVGEGNILAQDENVHVHSGASADSSITSDVVELGQKKNGEAKLSLPEESDRLPEVTKDLAPEDKDEENASELEVAKELAPDEESARLPEVTTELAPEDKDEENASPLEVAKELAPDEESARLPEVTMELAPEDKDEENANPVEVAQELAPDEQSARLPEVATELAPEDKDEENANPLEVLQELAPDKQSARLPEVGMELTPKDKDEESASPLKVEKEMATGNGKYDNIDIPATSDATESAVNKNEDKLTLSYSAKRVDTTEDSAHSQVCVTSAVRADQSTSWKSCCGLFEALTGTSR